MIPLMHARSSDLILGTFYRDSLRVQRFQTLVTSLQRVPENKKPLFRVQPIVFEQWPVVLSIVLYEN